MPNRRAVSASVSGIAIAGAGRKEVQVGDVQPGQGHGRERCCGCAEKRRTGRQGSGFTQRTHHAVQGASKKWSDLDLAIKADSTLDWKLLSEIKETFQESELPFRVDVLDWNDMTSAFRRTIDVNSYE
jgi:hypothetical protein